MVLAKRAATPKALLLLPVVWAERASQPKALLLLPVVLSSNACLPNALLPMPRVTFANALSPRDVLEPVVDAVRKVWPLKVKMVEEAFVEEVAKPSVPV